MSIEHKEVLQENMCLIELIKHLKYTYFINYVVLSFLQVWRAGLKNLIGCVWSHAWSRTIVTAASDNEMRDSFAATAASHDVAALAPPPPPQHAALVINVQSHPMSPGGGKTDWHSSITVECREEKALICRRRSFLLESHFGNKVALCAS